MAGNGSNNAAAVDNMRIMAHENNKILISLSQAMHKDKITGSYTSIGFTQSVFYMTYISKPKICLMVNTFTQVLLDNIN